MMHHRLYVITMVAACVSLVDLSTASGSGVDDGRWLQQLYVATGGDMWKLDCSGGWNMTGGANPCSGNVTISSWRKVGCNHHGRVDWVEFSSCNLNGTLPELDGSTGAMSQLQNLSLYSNRLSGTLPMSWSSFSNLLHIDLFRNQLNGTLPASWGNLSSLRHMDLSNNQLSGTLPASLASLINLEFVDLTKCQFNGTLPTLWSSMSRMHHMSLASNQLSGTLPISWSSLSNLQTMSLSGNQLSGALPASWGSLANLQSVSLSSNQLSGPIPASWSRLRAVVNVSLSANFLSGDLPASWYSDGMLGDLSAVDVRFNCLNSSSTMSHAAPWNWWLSKTSFGTGLLFQRTSCYCGVGQLPTLLGYWCEDCPAGHYCPNTSTSVPCPAGTYNPTVGKSEASVACLACPVGTTSNLTGQNSSRSCNISTAVMETNRSDGHRISSTVSTAAVIAGLPIALLSGGGSVGSSLVLQRSLLQLRLSAAVSSSSSCASPLDVPLDLASSPTQLSIEGTHSDGAYIRGAVVGNVLLLLGCGSGVFLIAVLLYWLQPSLLSRRRRLGRCIADCRTAAAAVRLPGLLAAPLFFLLQPTVSYALSCLLVMAPMKTDAVAANVPVGLVGCAVGVAGLVWCTLSVQRVRASSDAVPRRRRRSHRIQPSGCVIDWDRFVDWIAEPSCVWRSTTTHGRNFVQQYGVLFEGYRGGRHWFLIVEVTISVACGVIGALQSIPVLSDSLASCRGLVGALLAVNVVALVCGAVLRPYQRGWELLMFGASNALGVAWGAVVLLVDDSPGASEQLATTQVWLQVVQLGSAFVETFWHRFTALRQRRVLQPGLRRLWKPVKETMTTVYQSSHVRRERRMLSNNTLEVRDFLNDLPAPRYHQPSGGYAACAALIRIICVQAVTDPLTPICSRMYHDEGGRHDAFR